MTTARNRERAQRIDMRKVDLTVMRKIRYSVGWSRLVMADLMGFSPVTVDSYERAGRVKQSSPFALAVVQRMAMYAQSVQGRSFLVQMAASVIAMEPLERSHAILKWLYSHEPWPSDGTLDRVDVSTRSVGRSDIGILAQRRLEAEQAVRRRRQRPSKRPE